MTIKNFRGYERKAFTNSGLIISPSDINLYLTCPLSLWLKKKHPGRYFQKSNVFMIIGSFEHSCWEKVTRILRQNYATIEKQGDLDSFKNCQEIKIIILSKRDEFCAKFPQYMLEIDSHSTKLLSLFLADESLRAEKALHLLERRVKNSDLIECLFPIDQEVFLESSRLALKGFIDQIWKLNGSYVPIDLKTGGQISNIRLDDKHRVQLTCYALLLEEKRREPIDIAQIHFTATRQSVPFVLDDAIRNKTINLRNQVFELIRSNKEPKPCTDPYCSTCNPERKEVIL